MDDVTLILGDALAELPHLPHFDAVITDPPYGMNNDPAAERFLSGDRRVVIREHKASTWQQPIVGDDRPFDPTPWLGFDRVVLWGFQHFASRLPVGSTLVWIKKDAHLWGTFLSDADLARMKGGCGVYSHSRGSASTLVAS